MNKSKLRANLAAVVFSALVLALGPAQASPTPKRAEAGKPPSAGAIRDTLQRVAATATLRLGFREASIPFSYVGDDGQPRGYSVELCQKVAAAISRKLGLKDLKLVWVKVTPETRFAKLRSGELDLECGSTTLTLARLAEVDFSLITFADGAALLARAEGGSTRVADMAGRKIAVAPGTTTERALKAMLGRRNVSAETVPVKDHAEGAAAVAQGRADAYASDRMVLIGLAIGSGKRDFWKLPEDLFSYEPYALAMRRNDADFRLAVNTELARIFRSGEINDIYARWFQSFGSAGPLLESLYFLNGLPE